LLIITGLLHLFGKPKFPFPRDADIERLENIIARATENQDAGFGFSEVMSGFIHVGRDLKDFVIAAKLASSRCEAARFFLSVKSWNTEECKYYTTYSALYVRNSDHRSGKQQPTSR
jgi:hypothetical protein